MSHTYVPGTWTVLIGPDLTMFTDAAPDTALMVECWRLVDGGASVDDVIGAIVHEGLRAVGAFVLASRDRLLVRGAVTVELVSQDGTRRPLEPVSTPTWHEPAIDADVVALVLSTPDPPGDRPPLPLSHGVALASAVTVAHHATAVAAPPDPVRPVVETPAPQQIRATEPVKADMRFDELFAKSRVPSGSQEPALVPAVPVQPASPAPRPVARPAPPTEPSYEPQPASGFIDHLPWAPVGRGTPWDEPPGPQQQPDLGVTLRRPRHAPGGGTRVSAVRCPAGHLNPADASTCRVCQVTVAEQEPFETARPRLGVLLLSTDPEPVALDRSVVLGRAPSAQGDVDRIALHRPDISGNHVEVRLNGWQVLAVDLGSTNGTLVTTPDGRTSELVPNVPVELHHGTEVVLSEEIHFRFEVTS